MTAGLAIEVKTDHLNPSQENEKREMLSQTIQIKRSSQGCLLKREEKSLLPSLQKFMVDSEQRQVQNHIICGQNSTGSQRKRLL